MAKKKGEQIKPEVLEELSAAEKEISAPEEGFEAEEVEADVLEELATAEKEMMAEVPELVQCLISSAIDISNMKYVNE